MRSLEIAVDGLPRAKKEAKSMLAPGHPYTGRVVDLLNAAWEAIGSKSLPFPNQSLGLELVLISPTAPPSDSTSYLGGVVDVLEDKALRGELSHLGDLAKVAMYRNDNQLHEVNYRWEQGDTVNYRMRIWER